MADSVRSSPTTRPDPIDGPDPDPSPQRPPEPGAGLGPEIGPDIAPDTATATATAGRPGRWLALVGFAAAAIATAALGSRFSPADPATGRWYRRLAKPPFQPPSGVFAPVWTALYTSIALSGWQVWKRPDSPARRRALALWGVQLAANAAWTPTFFGARRPRLALGVLGAQLTSATAYAAAAARVDRPAAALVGPYLGWSAFAGVLNAEIVRRNPS